MTDMRRLLEIVVTELPPASLCHSVSARIADSESRQRAIGDFAVVIEQLFRRLDVPTDRQPATLWQERVHCTADSTLARKFISGEMLRPIAPDDRGCVRAIML